MGSSTSKTSAISAGAEAALGPEIAADLSKMIGVNVDAAAVANLIEFMPKNQAPVDGNVLEFLEANAIKLIGLIRGITGLTSEQIPDKTILNTIILVRKYGIIAIPYIVGIIAIVATALGVPVPIGVAFTTAQKAVQIADQIEHAITSTLSSIHTPQFMTDFHKDFDVAKQTLGTVMVKQGAYGGAYDDLKRLYGKKSGACDCDKIGGIEEETSLVAAREYLRTASSAAKTNLAQKINDSMSKFIKLDPPKGLSEVERANWLLAHLPGGPENKNNISIDKLDAACNALVGILNSFMGREIIAKNLDNTTKCAQAAEMLHALTAGMHLEFLTIQHDLNTIERNLDYLAGTEQLLVSEIIDKAKPDITEGERVEILSKKDGLKMVSDEIQRQMSMIRALTTGTINETDRDILKLIKDGTILRAEISEISDKNPSNKSFRQMLYKLLDMVVITGAVAAYLESALRIVGIKVDDYKNMNTLSQLDEAIIKMTPKDGNTETLTKFFKGVDILKQNFARRKDLKSSESSRASLAAGSYEGGRAKYAPTDSEKKMDARKNLRAVQLKAFANQLIRIYGEIERCLDEIVPFVGESIGHGEELDLFIERLTFLHEDGTLKGKTYEAMAGAVIDPLALQIRMEIIGRFKALIAIIDVLGNKSSGQGKDALMKLKKSIEDLIRLSDDTSEQFKKIIGARQNDDEDSKDGGVDISGSFIVDYGIGRSVLNLDKAIERMQAYSKVAKVRDNVRNIASDFKGTDSDYEALVGQSVAGMVNEINNVQRLLLQRIDTTMDAAANNDDKNRCKYSRDFVTSQMESVRNVWKASEAVDYYLGNFTHDIRLTAPEIRDITMLLEDVAVHKDWYDDKVGNILTGIYDNFPTGFNAGVAEYPGQDIINNNGQQHYYELFRDGKNTAPGNPIYGADILNHGIDAIKKAKAFSSRFVVLKNIVTLFYDLGSKYGKEKTKDSSRYMSPGSLLKVLMDYFTYGSFQLVSDVELREGDKVAAEITKVVNSPIYGDAKTYYNGIGAADKITLNKLTMDTFGIGLQEFISNRLSDQVTRRNLRRMNDGTSSYGANINGNPDGAFSIFMRSENYKYLKGGHILVKTDQMFCSMIKAMLAKILACVETFEIMKRPMMYNVYNSGVRQILGGYEVNIRPEYTELYIRLPLLVRFYKKIFSIDETGGFEQYNKLDRSMSRNLKISMMPDIDGLYGPLTQYMFSNDRLGVNNYTDSQMAVIIEKINAIIDTTSGSSPEEKLKMVIKGFIKEINRRFTLVTQEDMEKYKEMVQTEHNLWGTLQVNDADTYSTGTIVLDQDSDLDAFMRLPSDSYVTTSGLPKGVYGSDLVESIDRKYYGEYYQLYTRFRQMLDRYILENTVTNNPTPKMSYALEAIEKQIKMESNVQKKLEIISKFLDEGVNLSEVEKAKYVAFHEFIVASINSLSVIDAFITYIISVGYLIDPLGFGNAIIYDRLQGANSALGANTPLSFSSMNDLAINGMVLSNGINPKVLVKILRQLAGNTTVIVPANTMNNAADYGRNNAIKSSPLIRDILTRHVMNILYAVSGNKLFSIRISDSGVNVDYVALQDTIEKTYASVKSSMEKFRPYIDKAFYELYSGIIAGPGNANTVYKLYDDLIRVKLHGKEVYGATGQDKLDAILGRYYGLRQAFTSISEYTKTMKSDDTLRNIILSESIYDTNSEDLGTISADIATNGSSSAGLEPIKWFGARGSSIERMHMATNGDKSTIDLRFGARFTALYSWDGEFNMNRTMFFAMNQLVARFLGRCFDSSLEKVYKGCINPFDKIFANEISDPFNNSWSDIWPGIYRNKDGVLKTVISDKDSYAYVMATDMFPAGAVGNDGPKSAFSTIFDLNRPGLIEILGIPRAQYQTTNVVGQRNVPNPESMLYASIANIVRNIKGNKTGSGSPSNIAESLSEISQITKDIMREEMPIFKKYFKELGTRAQLLKEMTDKFSTDDQFAVVTAEVYPAKIRAPGVNIKSYLVRFFSKIIDIAETFEKAADDIAKELNVSHEYGEIFPGFIKTYQSKFGGLPLVPPSLVYSYVFARPGAAANDASKMIQFIPSTKTSASRYLSTFIQGADSAAASPIIDMIIKNFDTTINGPEQLRPEDIKNAVSGYITLIKYIGDCRQYKSMFTLPAGRTVIRSNVGTDNLITFFYPEIVVGGSYQKIGDDIDIVSPWAVNYFVDSSASKNPGIVLQQAAAAGATRYTNVIFITTPASEVLNKIATSTIHEIMLMIFNKFGVSARNVGAAGVMVDQLIVANILDMNIVPIDFSGFSRFIPFSNIMNYAYTLEKIAMDVLIKNDSEKSILNTRLANGAPIAVNSAESLMFGLLINPFAQVPSASNGLRDIRDNMFRGVTEIGIGRPKFLSDQVYQKLLFGEMFNDRVSYDQRGSRPYAMPPGNTIMNPRPTARNTDIELPTIRGSGEINEIKRDAYGYQIAMKFFDNMKKVIERHGINLSVTYEVKNTDNANDYEVDINVNNGTVVRTTTIPLGRIAPFEDCWGGNYSIVNAGNNTTITFGTLDINFPGLAADIAPVVAAPNIAWPANIKIPIITDYISIDAAPKIAGEQSFNSFADWVAYIRPYFLTNIAVYIRNAIYKDAIFRSSGAPPNIVSLYDIMWAEYLQTSVHDRLAVVESVLDRTVAYDRQRIFDSCGSVTRWKASPQSLATMLFMLYDYGNYGDALNDATALIGTISDSSAVGHEGAKNLMNQLNGRIRYPEKYNRSVQRSNIDTAATGRMQNDPHPLLGYFKKGTAFEESYPGDTINTNNTRLFNLSYIDPKQVGVSRIRYVPINNRDELNIISEVRFNTVLVRFVLFIVNAYRVTLHRLREDARNRTGKIAMKPEEILDDHDTEFIGFDMIE